MIRRATGQNIEKRRFRVAGRSIRGAVLSARGWAEHQSGGAFGARVGVESEPRGFWRASGRDYRGRALSVYGRAKWTGHRSGGAFGTRNAVLIKY